MDDAQWDIRRECRAWGERSRERCYLSPETIEPIDGKRFLSDEQRPTMLGLQLENVGIDAAVRPGETQSYGAR